MCPFTFLNGCSVLTVCQVPFVCPPLSVKHKLQPKTATLVPKRREVTGLDLTCTVTAYSPVASVRIFIFIFLATLLLSPCSSAAWGCVCDVCMMSLWLPASTGCKLTRQSALICPIIDCNQQSALLKVWKSGCCKVLMLEAHCRSQRQTCGEPWCQHMLIISEG